MTKTEEKLLERIAKGRYSRISVIGNREVQAAKKLHNKGLALFANQSALVKNCIRRRNGDYYSAFVYQGYLEKIDENTI